MSAGAAIESHSLGDVFVQRYRANESPRYALLILHGVGGHGGIYEPFSVHHAARGVDVWAMDAPGHGRSSATRARGAFRLEEWVDATLRVARYVRDVTEIPVVLVGSSLGVAPASAALASDDVAAAVLMGHQVPGAERGFFPRENPFTAPAVAQIATRLGAALRVDIARLIDFDQDYGWPGALEQKRLDPNNTWSYEFGSLLSFFTYRPPVAPAENRKPVLFAVGELDRLSPAAKVREVYEEFGGPAEYWEAPGAPHQLLLFATAAFSDAVDAFATKHVALSGVR